jgi:hypothetical protein
MVVEISCPPAAPGIRGVSQRYFSLLRNAPYLLASELLSCLCFSTSCAVKRSQVG